MFAPSVVLMLVAAALLAGERLWTHARSLAKWDRVAWAAVPLLVVVALTAMGVFVHSTPWWDFNGARLAPTISMFYGYHAYNLPDSGPVLCPHYPPISILIFLPAALSGNPTIEILIASICSGTCFFLPLVLLAQLVPRPWSVQQRLVFAVACLCLAYYSTWQVAVRSVAWNIAPDGAAIGFGVSATLAFLIAVRSGGLGWLVAAASLAAMAVWTKQTLVVVPAVLPLWGWLVLPPRRAAIFMALTGGGCVLLLVIFSATFGFARMWFNVIEIMRQSQWFAVADVMRDYNYPWRLFWWMSLPLGVGIIAQILGRLPAETTAVMGLPRTAFVRRIVAWWVHEPAALLLVLGLTLVPMCLLGRLKIGGDDHHYGPTLVFVAYFAVASLLTRHAQLEQAGPRRAARLRHAAGLLGLVLFAVVSSYAARGVWNAPSVFANPQESAYRALCERPHTYYFPWNPLAGLLAEGRVYHFSYGLMDRRISGHPIDQAHFDRHRPAHFKVVAIVRQRALDSPGSQDWQRYLPQFNREDRAYALNGWMTIGTP